ncbi:MULTISPECIES: flagellar filament capping protein FliD [Clostridium]|uniref:flagellar filament capping protein FliD n=1 Tax=Clostridium TaxID=1485 RepID=UPI000825FC0C|nr:MULTISPECIES: flagellar filament capping protein FliD [Clostridium]PJI09828.1 hypothetical protein CUB90_18995 [Clostridium sp. CT7]
MSSTIGSNPYSYVVPYSTSDLIGNENSVYTPNKSGSNSSTSTTSASGSYSKGLISQMSGLDVGQMTNEMLASDQVQLDKLYAKQQTSQWRQDMYRSIIDNLQHFQDKYFNQLSSDYIFAPNAFLTNSANSNVNNVSATALNNAKAGTYQITSATLATSANVTATLGSKPPAGTALSTLGIQSGVLHFTANGRNVSYNLNNSVSINTAMQDLSSMSGMNFNYSELTGKFSISTSKTGSGQNVDIEGVDDSTSFFNKLGMTLSGGTISTTDTARIDGNSTITANTTSSSDRISNTNLALKDGDVLSFTANGVAQSYTVDTSKTVGTLMSDLSSLTGSTFSYDASTGKISAQAASGQNLSLSYASGSSAQTFFNNTFGNSTSSTSITAAAGTSITSGNLITTNLGLKNGDTLSFSVNGGATENYTVDTTKSISTIMSDLSSLTGLNFSYNSSTSKISVEETGTQNLNISYADGSSAQTFFNSAFGATAGATSITQTSHGAAQGTSGANGTFTIKEPGDTSNGVAITESSNIFTVDGVQYNVSSAIDSSNPATITVKQDVSSAVSKIQEFVNEYNDLIGGVQTIINQRTGTASTGGRYSVLTLAQEQGMTTDQITKWNQKAQQGILSNDGLLVDMTTSMRTAFYTPVQANNLTMNGIGLSTSTKNYTDYGKITIDVSKLTTALQNNPQEVIDLFTKASTSTGMYTPDLSSTQLTARNSEEGIFQRISDIISEYAGTYVDKNGNQGKLIQEAGCNSSDYSNNKNAIYKELKDEQDAIATFKTKMSGDKTRYTNKFTALQSALSTLNSQSSYLSSMLQSSNS